MKAYETLWKAIDEGDVANINVLQNQIQMDIRKHTKIWRKQIHGKGMKTTPMDKISL